MDGGKCSGLSAFYLMQVTLVFLFCCMWLSPPGYGGATAPPATYLSYEDTLRKGFLNRSVSGPLLPYFLDSKNPLQPRNIYRRILADDAAKPGPGYGPGEKRPEIKYMPPVLLESFNPLNVANNQKLKKLADAVHEKIYFPKRAAAAARRAVAAVVGRSSHGVGRFWGRSRTRLKLPFNWSSKFRGAQRFASRLNKTALQAKALATVFWKMRSNWRPFLARGLTQGKWMYPGVNYIGPGNKLDEGKPVSYHDRLAYQHDHQYAYLQRKGVNPYFTFNNADRAMIAKVDTTSDEGMAEWLGMNAKRVFKSNRAVVPTFQPWEVRYGRYRNNSRGKR